MRQILCFFFFYLFIINHGISQTNDFYKLENDYTNYFEPIHETIFTHINKSKFFSNEQLWFKSYVYNIKTHLPYLTTTNVYAEIYNVTGQLMSKKLYYAENGMTHGNFDLEKTLQPGIYFLKVSTNWMKNFNGEPYSIEQFEILGDKVSEISTIEADTLYDFQLLPEGGKFLNDAVNTIGFKILDRQGKGVSINSGKVTDQNNNLISTFTGNELGMGKFNVALNNMTPFTVSVILDNGSEIQQKMSYGEDRGITISVNNLHPTNLFINFKTNSATISELLNKTYYLVIHRDGLLKKIDVNFEANKLDYVISIPKSELFDGINILTLFNNEKKPVLERMVFNHSKILLENIQVLGQITKKDSTEIRLRSSIKDTVTRNISVSVLPSTTKSYEFKNTIVSAFLLKPYLNGTIENPPYYFNDTDRKTTYDLDLLLLTQGWSSYSWNAIFSAAPGDSYHFESGMQLRGKINSGNKKVEDDVILYSGGSGLRLTTSVQNDNSFSFENLFLIDSSSVSISLIDKKGKLSKPNLYYNVFPVNKQDPINTDFYKPTKKTIYKVNFENFIFDDATILDTITIKTEKRTKQLNQMAQGSFRSDYIELSERYDPIALIIDVIRDNGFDVQVIGNDLTILSRRGATSFSQGQAKPNVFVDNSPVSGFDLNQLLYLKVADVEELYIARTPSGVGGTGGNINIFTRKTVAGINKKFDTYNSSIITFGFSVPDKYESPFYDKNNHELFENYGVLNWIPNLGMNTDGEFVFKIPNYMYESINLYIEGMGSDGSLISKMETIDLQKK